MPNTAFPNRKGVSDAITNRPKALQKQEGGLRAFIPGFQTLHCSCQSYSPDAVIQLQVSTGPLHQEHLSSASQQGLRMRPHKKALTAIKLVVDGKHAGNIITRPIDYGRLR